MFFFSYLPPKTECSFVMDDRRIQTTNPYKLQALFENQFFCCVQCLRKFVSNFNWSENSK